MAKEDSIPVLYLCIYDKLKEHSLQGSINHKDLKRIFRVVYRIKTVDMQLVLKEMEVMGLIKHVNLQLWQMGTGIRKMDDVRNRLYRQRGLSIHKDPAQVLNSLKSL